MRYSLSSFTLVIVVALSSRLFLEVRALNSCKLKSLTNASPHPFAQAANIYLYAKCWSISYECEHIWQLQDAGRRIAALPRPRITSICQLISLVITFPYSPSFANAFCSKQKQYEQKWNSLIL